MDRSIVLYRFTGIKNTKSTLGVLTVLNEFNEPIFTCLTLERGWLNNKPNVSCAPDRTYPIVLEYSPAFGKDLWELKDVPNRSELKVHVANSWDELEGCIALGYSVGDINSDNVTDILESGDAVEDYMKAMSPCKESTITITTHNFARV